MIPLDNSLTVSSVYGVSQARILEWVAISYSKESSSPEIEPESAALAGIFFTAEPPGKPCLLLCFSFSLEWKYVYFKVLFSPGEEDEHLPGI